jgi:hypothetical protein
MPTDTAGSGFDIKERVDESSPASFSRLWVAKLWLIALSDREPPSTTPPALSEKISLSCCKQPRNGVRTPMAVGEALPQKGPKPTRNNGVIKVRETLS